MNKPTLEDKIFLLEEEVKNKRNWQIVGVEHSEEYLASFKDRLLDIIKTLKL